MAGRGGGIIYQASNITFDGTNNLDTGIQLMDGRDFEMHIVFTPTVLSTSVKYFACRTTSSPFVGFDMRYRNPKWDLVGNNTDYFFNYTLPQEGLAVDILIRRVSGALTATIGGETKTPTISNTDKTLFIGSDCAGNGKAKMYLNELTIKAL